MARKIRLDINDFRIMKILQENARITNLQLSKEINLSPAPTLERVRKLEKAKLIKSYHAKLNYEALGIGIQALVLVSLERQMENPIHEFARQINEIPEIIECYQVTGNFDYQLRVMAKDINALNELITEKLGKIDEIGQFQSSVILATIKDSRVAPLNYDK